MLSAIRVRPARWPDDVGQVATIDGSYTTDRVYRLQRDELAFRLIPEAVDPPIAKTYPLPDPDRLRGLPHVAVAEHSGSLVGVVGLELSEWNQRLVIDTIYVSAGVRGRGVGRALIASAVEFARASGIRCIWLETQTSNYPAVQFYRRCGFQFVGLDDRLYDPADRRYFLDAETAIFFALDLATA